MGQFNGHDLIVAKLKGEFTWHAHDDTDDFVLVLKGSVTREFRRRSCIWPSWTVVASSHLSTVLFHRAFHSGLNAFTASQSSVFTVFM